MRFAMRIGVWAGVALATGCGGASRADSSEGEGAAGGETAGASSSGQWLADVPAGGTLTYDVSLGADAPTRRVQMRVQEVVRRGGGVAVLLAPVGTPLDEEPVYARWMVAENGELVGLDEHAGLTTDAGYAPIDEAGRLRTEASDSIAWRLPHDWLTPGRAVAGGEASAGWQLADRVPDLESLPGHHCVRLERAEAGERAALTVCASLGLVESTTTLSGGAVGPSWRLIAVDGPPPEGAETPGE